MKNIYTEPELELCSFIIKENINNNVQDTEDLSAVEGWPMPLTDYESELE